MPLHEVVYPVNPSYDTSSGQAHNTGVVVVDSGAEERFTPWDGSQLHFVVAHSPTSNAELHAVQKFVRIRRGALNGCLFKDWLDYSSAFEGGSSFVVPVTNEDQLIGVGDGTRLAFQLVKIYADDVSSITRNIRKPKPGTVVVAINGVDQPTGWTVNYTTGIVTFAVAPGPGAEVTAGFEYYVPVRIGDGSDKLLSARLQDFASGSIDVELVELINEEPVMNEYCYRGGDSFSIDANIALTVNNGCALAITPVGATRTVTLPDPTNLPLGGPYFAIRNASGTQSLLLKDTAPTTLATMAPGASRTVWLFDAGGGAKQWLAW